MTGVFFQSPPIISKTTTCSKESMFFPISPECSSQSPSIISKRTGVISKRTTFPARTSSSNLFQKISNAASSCSNQEDNTPLGVKEKTLAIFAPSVLLGPAMLCARARGGSFFNTQGLRETAADREIGIAGPSKTDGAKMASVFSLTPRGV